MLELYNFSIMKTTQSKIVLASVLIMVTIWTFIVNESDSETLKGLDLFLTIAIAAIAVVALILTRIKRKELAEGQPEEDELSKMLKYKAGYQAYMWSMYMWLFIFIVKDKFPNIESMIGGGILISVVLFYTSQYLVKRDFNEE